MAPNPRVANAFRAMRELGIKEEIVKPVLKNLLKLYDKNWQLIEEENYRALADAILDYEETKTVEQNKKPMDTNQHEYREEEAQLHNEPERPLKRLRLKNQGSPSSTSGGSSNSTMGRTSCREVVIRPQVNQPLPPSQVPLKDKRKEPLSSQIPSIQNTTHTVQFKEPKIEPGLVPLPIKKVPSSPVLIRPKDEPVTDNMLEYEVPIAILPPDPSCRVNSPFENSSTERAAKGRSVPASSNERRNSCELASMPKEAPPQIEVASSRSGEVTISLSCNSALGRPGFNMPSLDAVLRSVEDKCLRTYKITDPSFSVMNLMRDMCESYLELATESTDELLDKSTDVTMDTLGKLLDGENTQVSSGDEERSSVPAIGLSSIEVPLPKIYNMSSPMNGMVDHILHGKKNAENGICHNGDENSLGLVRKNKRKKADDEKSRSLVAKQNRLTEDEIRSFFDRNDVTRGEERVKISLVNEINKVHPPSFHYIPNNIVFQNACVNFALARIGDDDCCSTCFGDCLSSSVPCACAREVGDQFAYTLDELVKEEILDEYISMKHDPEKHKHFYCKECPLERYTNDEIAEPCKGHLLRRFIKECWSKCGCTKQCGNRVVQRGITCNLQVFMTAEKGWGIRTLEELPKGAFVCEYVGEILTNSELYQRKMQGSSSHSYPVLLDAGWGSEKVLKDEETLCLDATFYGNVARFFNHRCLDANMVEIPVEVETPDHHYYHIAFFTTRKVDAMEELTRDYGIDFDNHDNAVKVFRCLCGSSFCRNIKRPTRSRSSG